MREMRGASQGYLPTGPCVVRWLDNKSRMSGDVHVRFREHVGVRFPRVTRLNGCYTYAMQLVTAAIATGERCDRFD
jgi:hypothetical protein